MYAETTIAGGDRPESMAARLATELATLPPKVKAELVKLLAAPRKPSASKLLLDTRTVAECWLAGETVDARNRAIAAAEKKGGEYRSILITFADGFAVRTGSYMVDDACALAAATRFARARAMEQQFQRQAAWHHAECLAIRGAWWADGDDHGNPPTCPELDDGWQWVRLPDGSTRRTRACAVPEVVTSEFVEWCHPEFEPWRREVATEEPEAEPVGEFCPVDRGALAYRAKRLLRAVEVFSATEPDGDGEFKPDAPQSAVEAPTGPPDDSGPDVPPEPPSPGRRKRAGDIVPFKPRCRVKRASWAVVTPELFVGFVGPKAGAEQAMSKQPGSDCVRLPSGWRRGPNPWSHDYGGLIIDNARAKVRGERQRVRVRLAA